jgi:hypothetical protein
VPLCDALTLRKSDRKNLNVSACINRPITCLYQPAYRLLRCDSHAILIASYQEIGLAMARRKFRHRPEAVRKIRDRLRYIKLMIETNGSYRCSTGRVISRLGNPNGAACLAGRGNKESNAVQQAKADEFALKIAPIIGEIQVTWTSSREFSKTGGNDEGLTGASN